MNPAFKLTVGSSFAAAAIGYLAYLGAASSWQYYLSVDEAVADAASLSGKRIRISGRVAAGSLTIVEGRRQAVFELAGKLRQLHVTCHCPVPDNLAEGVDIVVEGTLQAGRVHGDKVITRCASKYQPEETATTRDKLLTKPTA